MSKQVEVKSIEEFQEVVAAQARVAVYEEVIRTVLKTHSEFDDVEDFSNAIVAALFQAAEADMKLINEKLVKETTG